MSAATLRCECCGAIQWKQAPRLDSVRRLVWKLGRATSRNVADELGISVANACNHLNRLAGLGVLRIVETRPVGTGGIEHVYEAAP